MTETVTGHRSPVIGKPRTRREAVTVACSPERTVVPLSGQGTAESLRPLARRPSEALCVEAEVPQEGPHPMRCTDARADSRPAGPALLPAPAGLGYLPLHRNPEKGTARDGAPHPRGLPGRRRVGPSAADVFHWAAFQGRPLLLRGPFREACRRRGPRGRGGPVRGGRSGRRHPAQSLRRASRRGEPSDRSPEGIGTGCCPSYPATPGWRPRPATRSSRKTDPGGSSGSGW
ncbi:hypothetical protein OV450_6621 [Actinobacteria bacterium OV450]|nr:hypothetical protein OV450_6621 [Actinobacteria bacterium OV450]